MVRSSTDSTVPRGRWRAARQLTIFDVMTRHHLFPFLLGLLLVTTGCRNANAPITIGLAGPLSAPFGEPMRLGARLAVDRINAEGGIRGRPLRLAERDDHADIDSAVAVAGDLLATDAVAVIGHMLSNTTMAAGPRYAGGRDPIALITPSSSAPEISELGPWVFRLSPTDLTHGIALARWTHDRLGLTRGTVVYLNNDYGRGVRRTFVQQFEALGGTVERVVPYLGTSPDLTPFLERLARDATSEFFLIAGRGDAAGGIVRALRARGLTIPVLGGDALESIDRSDGLAEGIYVSAAWLPSIDTPANREFITTWRARYPESREPNQVAAATWDAVHLLRSILETEGTERAAIRDALARVGETAPFRGATGSIAFDSLGDLREEQIWMGVIRGSTLLLAEGQ